MLRIAVGSIGLIGGARSAEPLRPMAKHPAAISGSRSGPLIAEREQRPKFRPNLHGLYDKPLSSRRLLNAFVMFSFAYIIEPLNLIEKIQLYLYPNLNVPYM